MMACNAKNFSPHHLLDVFVAFLSIITLIHCEVKSASVCKLSIADNTTLFKRLDESYEEEATTIIIEYTVGFNNVSADFDLRNKSSSDSFQPWRWYSTQGLSSSRLLLTYSFLYGTMKFFLSLGIEKEDLSIDVSPPGCLEDYENEELENFIRSFLMEALNVRDQPLKDLFFCIAHINESYGNGFLIHRCCNLDTSHEVHCDDVSIDRWVTYLHCFIMVIVVIVVCSAPRIIQTPYRVVRYNFSTPRKKNFEFFLKIVAKKEDVPSNSLQIDLENMKHFEDGLEKDNAGPGKIYKVCVKEADLELSENRIFMHGSAKFSFPRALSELLEKCQSFCGDGERTCNDCCLAPSCCRTVISKMYRLFFNKTLPAMLLLASPSVPILYSMCKDDLWYKELDRAYRKRGLSAPFNLNFYLYAEQAYGFVGIVSLFYLIHYLYIVFSSGQVRNFYTAMFNDSDNCIAQHLKDLDRKTNKSKICFLFLHRRNLFLKIPPFIFVKSVVSILCTKFKDRNKTFLECVHVILIGVSACSVLIIIMLGAMFLAGVVVILIVIVTFEGGTIYNFIPVAFWLAVYLWTSLKNLHKPFDLFMGTLFETDICKDLYIDSQVQNDVQNGVQNDVQNDVQNGVQNDFQNDVQNGVQNDVQNNVQKDANISFPPEKNQPKSCVAKPPFFEVRHNALRVRLKHPFIDIYRSRISKKFFYHCVNLDHVRAPGSALKNNWKAVLLFCKLGTFITFVYLVLMAYSNILFISPTNRVFVTFVAGILPSVVQKLYGDDSAMKKINPTDKRFLKELGEKINTFSEKWIVRDFSLVSASPDSTERSPDLCVIKAVTSVLGANSSEQSPNLHVTKPGTSGLGANSSEQSPNLRVTKTATSGLGANSSEQSPDLRVTKTENSNTSINMDPNNQPKRANTDDVEIWRAILPDSAALERQVVSVSEVSSEQNPETENLNKSTVMGPKNQPVSANTDDVETG